MKKVPESIELILKLRNEFSYCTIPFSELPVWYNIDHHNINMFTLWYDNKLREKISNFMSEFKMRNKKTLLKFSCLPKNTLENKIFQKLLKDHEFLRLNINLKNKVPIITLWIDKKWSWITNDQKDAVNQYLKKVCMYKIIDSGIVFGEILATQHNYLEFEKLHNLLELSDKEIDMANNFSLFLIDTTISKVNRNLHHRYFKLILKFRKYKLISYSSH